MKKKRNTLIFLWILWVCVSCIILSLIFSIALRSPNDSYFELLEWNATINETDLRPESPEKIIQWDTITTRSESLWVISWWDGSLTRVWENSKIQITRADVSPDMTEINISFDLLSWKTWSKVVSFLGSDSYFKQNFNDIEAWVRGTVFDVDLDAGVIHVGEHSVELTTTDGKSVRVTEWQAFNLSSFSFLELSEYIRSFRDATGNSLNVGLDTDYNRTLLAILDTSDEQAFFEWILRIFSKKKQLIHLINTANKYSRIEDFLDTIPQEKYGVYYKAVLSEYQKHNIVKSSDVAYYKKKIYYKRALTHLAPSKEERQHLLQSSLFDLSGAIKNKNITAVTNSLDYITAYKDDIWDLDIPLDLQFMNKLPSFFNADLLKKWNSLGSSFKNVWNFSIPDISLWDIDIESLWNNANEVFQEKKQEVEGLLQWVFSEGLPSPF